jgi:hypothetical protein
MNGITNPLLNVQIDYQTTQSKVVCSKTLTADQSTKIQEKILHVYEEITKQLDEKTTGEVERVDFSFDKERRLNVTLVKKDQTIEEFDIEGLSEQFDTVKVLEEDLLDAVAELSKRTWRPNKLLDIQVTKQGDEFDVLTSQNLSTQQTQEVKEKIKNIYQAVMRHLPSEIQEGDLAQVNFGFNEGGELKVTLIQKNQKIDVIDSKILLADEIDEIKQVNRLFDVIDEMRQNALVKPHQPLSNFQKFLRVLVYFWTVKPAIQKFTREMVQKQNSAEQLKALYVDPNALYRSIKNKLLARQPQLIKRLFDEKDLGLAFQTELVKGVQERVEEIGKASNKKQMQLIKQQIKELKSNPDAEVQVKNLKAELNALESIKTFAWSESEFKKLDILRIMHHLRTHDGEPNSHLFEVLRQVPVLEIPIKELKKIEVTPTNTQELVHMWKHIGDELFKAGQLQKIVNDTDLKAVIVQTDYAIAYLNALNSIPKEIKNELVEGQTLGMHFEMQADQRHVQRLKDFVIQRSQREMELDEAALGKGRHVYKECVLHVFNQMKLDSLDLLAIVDCLTLKNSSLVDQFIQKVNERQAQLPVRFKHYSPERLQNILRTEFEKLLVSKFHLTTPQLVNIRAARMHHTEQQAEIEQIKEVMQEYSGEMQNIKALRETIAKKKESLADALLELPRFALPIALTDQVTKEAAIQSSITKELAEVTKANKKLMEDVKKAKTKPQKAKIEREREPIKARKAVLEAIKADIGAFLQNPDHQAEIERILSAAPPIEMEGRKVDLTNITEADRAHLKVITEVKESLENAGQAGQNDHIKQINEALARIKSFGENRAEIPAMELKLSFQEIDVKEQLNEWSTAFFQDLTNLDSLTTLSQSDLTTDQVEALSYMWQTILKHTFEKAGLTHINSDAVLNEDIKYSVKNYMRLRAAFQSLPPNAALTHQILPFLKKLERSISNPAVKTYLNEASNYYRTDANELLFGHATIATIVATEPNYSTFNPDEQAHLMAFNGIYNKQIQRQKMIDEMMGKLEWREEEKRYMDQAWDALPAIDQQRRMSEALAQIPAPSKQKIIDEALQGKVAEFRRDLSYEEKKIIIEEAMQGLSEEAKIELVEKEKSIHSAESKQELIEKAIDRLSIENQAKLRPLNKPIDPLAAQAAEQLIEEEKEKIWEKTIQREVREKQLETALLEKAKLQLTEADQQRLLEPLAKKIMEPRLIEEGINQVVMLNLTTDDKQQMSAFLEIMRTNPSFKAKMNRYFGISKTPNARFLNNFPTFLHGFIKRYIMTDLNKPVEPKPEIVGGISEETLKFLKDYFGKIKNLEEQKIIEELNTKSESLLNKMLAKEPIDPSERLTLRELGTLSRSERLEEHDFAQTLETLGIANFDPDIKRWLENHNKTKAIFKALEKSVIRPAINAHYKDGCLLAHTRDKRVAWTGRPAAMEERMVAYVSGGFTHGAKLYRKDPTAEEIEAAARAGEEIPGEQVYLSHVVASYQQEPLSLYELASSDVWEIDVAPLVNPALQDVLKKMYGNQWEEKINQLYQGIEKELHSKGEKRFGKIKNNEQRRIKAGLANRPWLWQAMGQDVKGHVSHLKKDFNALHKKFFQEEPLEEKQICSEFASKSTLAAMVQLNKVLSQQVKEHLHAQTPEATEQALQAALPGKTPKEIKSAKEALLNEAILDLPYKSERMSAIHPGRMSELLVMKGCAKKIPPPPAMERFINFDPAVCLETK